MTEFLGLDHVQVAIPAGAEDAARAFYGGVLGLEEIPKPAVLAVRGGCWFACGAQQIHIGAEQDFRPARKAHPAFLVADLEALRRRLEAQGCVVSDAEPLDGVRRGTLFDPFGNRLELLQRL